MVRHANRTRNADTRRLTLDQLAEVFPGVVDLAARVTTRTLTEYQRDASDYLTYCGGDSGRARRSTELRAWRQHLVDHTDLSPHTINRRLATIRRLVQASAVLDAFDYGEAYRFSLVESVDISTLRHRQRPYSRRLLSPTQIRAICSGPDSRTLIGLRDGALLHTLASSGCRISEVLRLEQSSILPSGDHWFLEVPGQGRDKPRLALLSKEAYDWISRWLTARSEHIDCAAIFTTFGRSAEHPSTKPLSRYAAYKRVQHYAQLAGLEHVKPQDFRRFLGAQLVAKAGLRQAQLALGHSSPETTARDYLMDNTAGN